MKIRTLYHELIKTYANEESLVELEEKRTTLQREANAYRAVAGKTNDILAITARRRHLDCQIEVHCIEACIADIQGSRELRDTHLKVATTFQANAVRLDKRLKATGIKPYC